MFYSIARRMAPALLLLALATSELAAQGLVDGFLRGQGRLSASASWSHESYSQYFVGGTLPQNSAGENPDPTNPNLGTITTQSASLYLAGGVTDDLDLIVNLPYVWASPDETSYWASQSGWQDISIAAKYRPLRVDIADVGTLDLIAAAGISFPLSDYIADAPVAIGHYSTNLDGRILAHLTHASGGFLTLQGGYIRRGNVELDRGGETTVPDAVDLIAKAGYADATFYADAWIQRQNAQGGTNLGAGVPFPSNGISFTRVGINGAWHLPWVDGLTVGVGGALTLDGRNVGKSRRISAGLTYNVDLLGREEN